MSSHQILDSSPVPIPPVRPRHEEIYFDGDAQPRPLKRSSSLASLPTPPRTHHKRSRSRAHSSGSTFSLSEGDESATELNRKITAKSKTGTRRRSSRIYRQRASASDGDALPVLERIPAPALGHKKRRTQDVLPGHDEELDSEDEFWLGGGSTTLSKAPAQTKAVDSDAEADVDEPRHASKEGSRSPSPALLQYRVKAPVSPPPSRRQPQLASVKTRGRLATPVARPPIEPLPPVTPPRRLLINQPKFPETRPSKAKDKRKVWPVRDSPNNPFLEDEDKASGSGARKTSWESSDDEAEVGEALMRGDSPSPVKPYEEKPTMTYVFRGVKAQFANPLYKVPEHVIAASRLPLDHPDYEPAEFCPPRRLFGASKKRTKGTKGSASSGEDDKKGKLVKEVLQKSDRKRSFSDSEEEGESQAEEPLLKMFRGQDHPRGFEPVFTKQQPHAKEKPISSEAEPPAVIASSSSSLATSSHAHPSASIEVIDKGRSRADVLARAREARVQREKAGIERREGFRADAVFPDKDDPAMRAMGPTRSPPGRG